MKIRTHLATGLTVLTGVGIGYVGLSYLIDPAGTAPGFGMATWPEGDAATFLATKGARDLVSGLLPLALLLTRQRRALGWAMAIESLVPAADAALILSTGGSTTTALAVHGATAVVVLATGVLLLTERRGSANEPAPTTREEQAAGV